MDQSRFKTLPYQWRNSLRPFSWLRGQLGPFTSTRTASTYVQARNTTHETRNSRHTLDQTAATFVETSWNGRDLLVQSPHHRRQFLPVCDDTRDFGGQFCCRRACQERREAFSLLSMIGVKWIGSLGQYSSVYMPPAYLLLRLHRETPLLTQRMFCSQHDVSASVSAQVWRMLHHTLWSLLAKGITAMFANLPNLREVR